MLLKVRYRYIEISSISVKRIYSNHIIYYHISMYPN